jgi:hypothetical protein
MTEDAAAISTSTVDTRRLVPKPLLVIACGALAREINQLKLSNGWEHLHLRCIDARLHNRLALIPERV